MNKLRKLILFRERHYSDRDQSLPSIEDNKNMLSEGMARDIVKYLESGRALYEFVSPTVDPYDQSDAIPNILLSDGTYVWDGVIINWVRKYRVRLPEAFLLHVEEATREGLVASELSAIDLIKKLKCGVEDIY